MNNIELKKVEQAKELLKEVISIIENNNEIIDEKEYYNFGNNNIINNEDLETIVSTIETLENIIDYNGGIR